MVSSFFPASAKRADVRFGINLIFGREKNKRKKPEAVPLIEPIPIETLPQDITDIAKPIIEKDTVIEESTSIIITPPGKSIFVPDPVPEIVEDGHETVKVRNYPLELAAANYVIVGAFINEANAYRYSQQLINAGFNNEYGFITEKRFFYVWVHKEKGNIEGVRRERDK